MIPYWFGILMRSDEYLWFAKKKMQRLVWFFSEPGLGSWLVFGWLHCCNTASALRGKDAPAGDLWRDWRSCFVLTFSSPYHWNLVSTWRLYLLFDNSEGVEISRYASHSRWFTPFLSRSFPAFLSAVTMNRCPRWIVCRLWRPQSASGTVKAFQVSRTAL